MNHYETKYLENLNKLLDENKDPIKAQEIESTVTIQSLEVGKLVCEKKCED